jgi:hypothetical protein
MPKTILGGVENRVGEKTYVYQEDEHSNKQNLIFLASATDKRVSVCFSRVN